MSDTHFGLPYSNEQNNSCTCYRTQNSTAAEFDNSPLLPIFLVRSSPFQKSGKLKILRRLNARVNWHCCSHWRLQKISGWSLNVRCLANGSAQKLRDLRFFMLCTHTNFSWPRYAHVARREDARSSSHLAAVGVELYLFLRPLSRPGTEVRKKVRRAHLCLSGLDHLRLPYQIHFPCIGAHYVHNGDRIVRQHVHS